jgi:ADP-heptose:LPS heptosyltransferase
MLNVRRGLKAWGTAERWYFLASVAYTAAVRLLGLLRPHRAVRRILIVKHDAIGDMVYALPAIHWLRAAHPNAHITVWCNKPPAGLLVHDDAINEIVWANTKPTGTFDWELELRGNWQTLVHSLRHPPRRRNDRGTIRLLNKLRGTHPHDLEINLAVAWPFVSPVVPVPPLSVAYTPADVGHVESFLRHWGIGQFAVLHVGGSTHLRRWPLSHFAALAAHLQQRGLAIVVCGGQEEKHLIEDFRHLLPAHVLHACALFSLTELAALCAKAAIFVGNESGPLHIAAAAGCPVLGLFGPGEPNVFYPRGTGREVRAEVLHVVLPCNPCDQIHCVHPDNPCIARISVAQAIAKTDLLLQQQVAVRSGD